jgi:hypothetical protein
MIGSVIVMFGMVLLLLRKQRKFAIACLIAGLALIVIPYTLIFVFLD